MPKKLTKQHMRYMKALAQGKRDHGAGTEQIEAELNALGYIQINEGKQPVILSDGKTALKRFICEQGLEPENAYQAQHQSRVHIKDAEGIVSTINEAESPLLRLRRRKDKTGAPLLSDIQFAAGERLRKDFTFGQLSSLASTQLDKAMTGGASLTNQNMVETQSDYALDALDRFRKAHNTLKGELASVVIDVCCYLKPLSSIEQERNWPVRSGRIVLAIALDCLADHYGFSNVAKGRK